MDGSTTPQPRIYPPSRKANAFPPTQALKPADLWKVDTFLARAAEMCANWDDAFPDGPEGQTISRHRAKALYVDFRFFIAKKEPINMPKMLRLLRPRFRRAAVHRYLAEIAIGWDRGDRGRYPGVTQVDRFIMAKFNAEIFHCDPRRDRQTAALAKSIADDEARAVLIAAIGHRVELIRRLSEALAPFRSGVQEFWLP